jgi:hypothetical protein
LPCRLLNCVQQVFGKLKAEEGELALRNPYVCNPACIPQPFQGLFRHAEMPGSLFFRVALVDRQPDFIGHLPDSFIDFVHGRISR